MRLMNTETLELKEFFGNPEDPYTILSHTWGDAEITLQEFQSAHNVTDEGRDATSIARKAGHRKILDCCKRSLQDGLRWTWIDTCCIDKTNSVELSEAINSMFQWYQNAAICYIFLHDVERTSTFEADPRIALQHSRWFTRGWTLQELIAPTRLLMFDASWQLLGELTEGSALLGAVSEIAGIPQRYLDGNFIYSASISMRMSWAARRQTTRAEDMAYCLLGIFNVNMPLLYGEGGRKAFIRLQEEIIKSSDDQTIFAWESGTCSGSMARSEDIGILATTPKAFQYSGNLVPSTRNPNSERRPFEMTNLGLRICQQFCQGEKDDEFLGMLDCHKIDEPDKRVALRFGSSWSILIDPYDDVLLWTLIILKKIRRMGRNKKRMESNEISGISEVYRDYKRGPIKDGATMFRRSGTLLFEDVIQSSDVPWYSFLGERITILVFLGRLPSISAAPEVFISQPRTSRPPITKIVFKFPRHFTWEVLETSHQVLEEPTRPEEGLSLAITDLEPHETVRKDVYISLERDLDRNGPISFWKSSRTRKIVASFHWQSEQQTYSLLLDHRTLAELRERMPNQQLYTSRKRWARTRLHLGRQHYSSLITNYGHHIVHVEIREDPWNFGISWYNQDDELTPLLILFIILVWFCLLTSMHVDGKIIVTYSLGLLLSLCMFKPRYGPKMMQLVVLCILPLFVISLISWLVRWILRR